MSLELLMLGNVPVAQMVERAKLAEANGYDTLWVADERFYREVYATLAILAQHTTRVHLGTCVTDPFSRHPALTAMAIATLDEISNQRAILGFGAGISGFAELGIVRKKPAAADARGDPCRARAAEGRDGRLPWRRDRLHQRQALLQAGQRRRFPVYVASNGPLGQRMTGAVADGAIMEGCGSVEEVKAFRAILAEGREAQGPRSRRGEGGGAPQCLRWRRRQEGARRRAAGRGPHAGGGPAEIQDSRDAGAHLVARSDRAVRQCPLCCRRRALCAAAAAGDRSPCRCLHAGRHGRTRSRDT